MKPDPESLEKLRQLTLGISPLPEADWAAFAGLFEPFAAGRKVTLTETGQYEKYLYFVLEGVQRIFLNREDGREATLIFTYPPSFAGVLDSIMLNTPSRYEFETLSASRFLRAPVSEINFLTTQRPAIAELIRKGLSHALSGLLERLAELQSFSSAEKFRSLLTRSPHILQWVPHKYLANYIGIEPTNFSKLINSVKP